VHGAWEQGGSAQLPRMQGPTLSSTHAHSHTPAPRQQEAQGTADPAAAWRQQRGAQPCTACACCSGAWSFKTPAPKSSQPPKAAQNRALPPPSHAKTAAGARPLCTSSSARLRAWLQPLQAMKCHAQIWGRMCACMYINTCMHTCMHAQQHARPRTPAPAARSRACHGA